MNKKVSTFLKWLTRIVIGIGYTVTFVGGIIVHIMADNDITKLEAIEYAFDSALFGFGLIPVAWLLVFVIEEFIKTFEVQAI